MRGQDYFANPFISYQRYYPLTRQSDCFDQFVSPLKWPLGCPLGVRIWWLLQAPGPIRMHCHLHHHQRCCSSACGRHPPVLVLAVAGPILADILAAHQAQAFGRFGGRFGGGFGRGFGGWGGGWGG
jgi:hypothetical protein